MNRDTVRQALLYGASIVVVIVVLWGFLIIGSPGFNRKVSADRNRIEDLDRLKTDIDLYFEEQRKLPTALTDLKSLRATFYGRRLKDPVTGKMYGYSVKDTFSYELCADFELTSKQAEIERRDFGRGDTLWEYGAGRNCFDFEIPVGKREKAGG